MVEKKDNKNGLLAFVDDIAILSETEEDAKKLLNNMSKIDIAYI